MAEKKQTLSENYLVELFKACLTSQNVLEVVNIHLQDNFLPEESYKHLWSAIKDSFLLTNKVPSIGILNEKLKNDSSALKMLLDVKKCKVPEIDNIFPTFESFIKEVRFIELYTDIGKLWNQGKQEDAIKQLAEQSEEINNFSLKEGLYAKVFTDFDSRNELRKNKEQESTVKVPFGINALDYYTRGGINIGTSALFLGRSGTGKTTLLRWIGICAARKGLRVIHFQIEGGEQECLDAYDAAWVGDELETIEFGGISKDKIVKVKNIQKDIVDKGGEIFVIAPAQFDSLSIDSCRDTIEEIEKTYGKVSLCLFDNLELFTAKGKFGYSEMGERMRRETIANKITNLSVMYKMACVATTQANDVRPDKFNSPDFVLTRSDINEFKNLVKPFSFFASINQTNDEYDSGICRIYIDKMRKYKSGMILTICQALNTSRFYDSHKTLNTFWNAKENKPI